MPEAKILDLHNNEPPAPIREAEHALIGIALNDPSSVVWLDELTSEQFAEPTYGRILEAIRDLVRMGRGCDAIGLANQMGSDPGLASLGGMAHLADLIDYAPPTVKARDYAAIIIDHARRRRLCEITAWAQQALRRGDDTGETIQALEAEVLAVQRHSRSANVVSAEAAVRAMLEDLNATEEQVSGVFTGISALDDHLGRLQADELILIAGRPGAGKSALAACVALNIARAGLGVIEINSEMSVAQMVRRHVSDACHAFNLDAAPTYKDIKRRTITPAQNDLINAAAAEVSALPLAMVKKTGLTISALRSLVRRQTAEWHARGITLGAITVDHVGLLQADGGGRDRYTDQTNIAIAMKALADELKVPVIALVQLSRKVEDRDNKRPQLSDLRDSGAWEENADVAIGVYREAYYANKEPEPKDDGHRGSRADLRWDEWDRKRRSKVVEAILMKVREGEEATIELWASIGHNAIRSRAPEFGGFR